MHTSYNICILNKKYKKNSTSHDYSALQIKKNYNRKTIFILRVKYFTFLPGEKKDIDQRHERDQLIPSCSQPPEGTSRCFPCSEHMCKSRRGNDMAWKLLQVTQTGLNDLRKRIISQRFRNRDGWTRTTTAEKLRKEVLVKMICVFRQKWCGFTVLEKRSSQIHESLISHTDMRERRKQETKTSMLESEFISTWRTHCQPQNGLQLPVHKRTGRAETSAKPQKPVTWVCTIKTAKTEHNQTTSCDPIQPPTPPNLFHFSVLHNSLSANKWMKNINSERHTKVSLLEWDTEVDVYWEGV